MNNWVGPSQTTGGAVVPPSDFGTFLPSQHAISLIPLRRLKGLHIFPLSTKKTEDIC